jgi:hypothetical protein
LCIPSHYFPESAVVLLYASAPVGLWPSPFSIALWVPNQVGAGNLILTFPQGMAEASKFSSHHFKVNIRLTSYSPQLCVGYFLTPKYL